MSAVGGSRWVRPAVTDNSPLNKESDGGAEYHTHKRFGASGCAKAAYTVVVYVYFMLRCKTLC